MLTDRGYVRAELQESYGIWKSKVNEQDKIRAILLEKKINKAMLLDVVKEKEPRIILIQPKIDTISVDVEMEIERIFHLQDNSRKIIEVFNSRRLMFNVSKHYLVPKHILLTDEEKQIVLQQLHINEYQLKVIEYSDPMAKYLGMLEGQVCKIIRPSETSMYAIDYRICRK